MATTSCSVTGDLVLYENAQGDVVYGDQKHLSECPVTISDDHWMALANLGLVEIQTSRLPDKVTSLDVPGNRLVEFPAMSNWLAYINLEGNPITSLKNISFPATLGQLNVQHAQIVDASEVEIPPSLQVIWMGSNQLRAIPKIKSTGIQELYLGDNPIESFPADFVLPESLKYLVLSNSSIPEIHGVKFPAKFTELYIRGTPVSSMKNIKAPALQLIDMGRMGVAPLRLKDFKFPTHAQIYIDLSYNKQMDFHGAKFPNGSSLLMESCELTSIKDIPLPTQMETIRLTGNKFTAFPQFPKNQPGITEIYIDSNELSAFSSVSLPPKLERLDLSMNNIVDIRGINFSSSLMFLNLTGNPLATFEISSNNFKNWQQKGMRFSLETPAPTGKCSPDAVPRIINGTSICILDDATWEARYPQSFVWDDSTSTDKNSTTLSAGAIVGIVIGGLAAVALVVGVFLMWRRKHRSSGTNSKGGPTANSTSDYHLMGGGAGPVASMLSDAEILACRIPFELVQVDSLLGKGGFGEVYRGFYRDEQVAIKKLFAEHSKNMHRVKGLLDEARVMSKMDHPNIVRLIGVAWEAVADLCIVEELLDGGDLRSLLIQYNESGRPRGVIDEKLRMAIDIANGLMYMHGLKPMMLHRDLKSSNVLLNGLLEAKLTDFGISRETSLNTMTAGVGTSLWMAPEVMTGGHYDEKADIFSFGVILSELDTHELPYASSRSHNKKSIPEAAILQQVAQGKISASFSQATSAEILVIARRCLSLDPAKRPTAAEVVYSLDSVV